MAIQSALLHRQYELPGLQLEWRVYYRLLSAMHVPSSRAYSPSGAAIAELRSRLVKVIVASAHYFSRSSSDEILDLFEPLLIPFDNAFWRAQASISLFISHAAGARGSWKAGNATEL